MKGIKRISNKSSNTGAGILLQYAGELLNSPQPRFALLCCFLFNEPYYPAAWHMVGLIVRLAMGASYDPLYCDHEFLAVPLTCASLLAGFASRNAGIFLLSLSLEQGQTFVWQLAMLRALNVAVLVTQLWALTWNPMEKGFWLAWPRSWAGASLPLIVEGLLPVATLVLRQDEKARDSVLQLLVVLGVLLTAQILASLWSLSTGLQHPSQTLADSWHRVRADRVAQTVGLVCHALDSSCNF
jgi:hypothetical protein